jgi:hypothetical protein
MGGSVGVTNSNINVTFLKSSAFYQPYTGIIYGNWGTNAKIIINSQLVVSGSTQLGTIASSFIGRYSGIYYSEFELCEIFVVDYGRDLYEAEIRHQFRYLNNYYRGIY